MEMNIQSILPDPIKKPVIIAGPCSAETEEQVMETARQLKASGQHIDFFRSGIWKPRTRPNSFEGVGKEGLQWLKMVKAEFGFKTCTEVANTAHVFHALKSDVDLLWLGARTTVNPFSVQEVADAMEGVDKPVLIKNPINPDLGLWIGAIERIYKAGITKIGVIHRGFSSHGETKFRNVPRWQIAIELKRRFPDLMMICDNSHICGRRDLLAEIAQQAMDLNYDGIMTETHCNPDEAWSDAAQQITPDVFKQLVDGLIIRNEQSQDQVFNENIGDLRRQIDELDEEIINLLGDRMALADAIGAYKKRNNISILQSSRFNEIVEQAVIQGGNKGLSQGFITTLLHAIHQESINHQKEVYQQTK